MSKGKIVLIVIAALIGLVVFAGIMGGESNTDSNPAEANVGEKTKAVSESDVEEFCQDAFLIEKYVKLDDVEILSFGGQSFFDDNTGEFTKSGEQVYSFNWLGEDKNTDKNIRLMCWVSGDKDNFELQRLVIDSDTKLDNTTYNKSGEAIE